VIIRPDDLEECKLKKTSYIHCYSVFTIEKSLIFRKVGRLSEEKVDEIKGTLKKVFGIR